MAICGCSNGLVATAVVALVVLPVQYLVPPREVATEPVSPPVSRAWLERALARLPPLQLLATLAFIVLAVAVYLCGWIQRKIMERRIVKLNHYLSSSLEHLRAWDSEQEQIETNLKLVQNATSEYNLLLFLLLRQHRCLASHCPPSHCIFDKGLGDFRPTVDV